MSASGGKGNNSDDTISLRALWLRLLGNIATVLVRSYAMQPVGESMLASSFFLEHARLR